MKAWFVRGTADMYLREVTEPDPPPPGWVQIRVRVVQPSVAEAMAFKTGR